MSALEHRLRVLQKVCIAAILAVLAFQILGTNSLAAQSAAPRYLQTGGDIQTLTCSPSPSPVPAYSNIQIVLLIDDSGSMRRPEPNKGSDQNFSRNEGAKNLVDILLQQHYLLAKQLHDHDPAVVLPDVKVAVIHFNTNVVDKSGWVEISPDKWENQRVELDNFIDRNRRYPYTNNQRTDFKPPFNTAAELFKTNAPPAKGESVQRAILLFTDGVPDLGNGELKDKALSTEMNNIGDVVKKGIPQDVKIYVTGFNPNETYWNTDLETQWRKIARSPSPDEPPLRVSLLKGSNSLIELSSRMEEIAASLIDVQRLVINPVPKGSTSYPILIPHHVQSLRVTHYTLDSISSFSIKGPGTNLSNEGTSIQVWELTRPAAGDYIIETTNNKGIVTALITYQNMRVKFENGLDDLQAGRESEIKFTIVDESGDPVVAKEDSLNLKVSVTQNGQETQLEPTGDVYQFSWTPKDVNDQIKITAQLIDAKEKTMLLNCSDMMKFQVSPPTKTATPPPASGVTITSTSPSIVTPTFTLTAVPIITATPTGTPVPVPCCVTPPPCTCDGSWQLWFWLLTIILIVLLIILLVFRFRSEPEEKDYQKERRDIFRTNYWHLLFWPLVILLILLILNWLWWSCFIPPWVFLILLWISVNTLILIWAIIWSHQSPIPPPPPDDLTIIEGIGPEIEKLLNEKGITTFKQLSMLSEDKIKEWLGKRPWGRLWPPKTWPKQAELADKFIKSTAKKKDLDEFNKHLEWLKAGMDPVKYDERNKDGKPPSKGKKTGKK